jgi:hypothetical protein
MITAFPAFLLAGAGQQSYNAPMKISISVIEAINCALSRPVLRLVEGKE